MKHRKQVNKSQSCKPSKQAEAPEHGQPCKPRKPDNRINQFNHRVNQADPGELRGPCIVCKPEEQRQQVSHVNLVNQENYEKQKKTSLEGS